MKSIFRHLYFQVIVAIALGILTGIFFPGFNNTAKLISEVFINLIKLLIAPIVSLTIVMGIAKMSDMRKVGRVGGKALLYFEIVTTIALVIGLVIANVAQPGKGIAAPPVKKGAISSIEQGAANWQWGEFLLHLIPSNLLDAFAKGDILQILVIAVLIGYGISKLGDGAIPVIRGVEKASLIFFSILKLIMRLAPLGAFGGMAFTIGKFGWSALLPLGKLMLCVYATMLVFIFVVLGLIAKLYGFSIWQYLKYIRNEILIVLGTSSSESALPSMIEKMEQIGCAPSVVGLVIPTGYSFNLDGTTIYLSMAVIFLAQVFQVNLSIGQELTIIGILMITSKGAAAVTGGGFIVLASTLAAMKVIPVEGLAILLGVDRFMSEARAITNLIGNGVATIVIAKSEKAFDEEKYQTALAEKAISI